MRFRIILLLIAPCIFIPVAAKTVYVSKVGKDNNSGLGIDDSFLSIQRAIEVMDEGDTCIVLSGIYRETLKIKDLNHLTFKSYKKDEVIVSGLDEVNDWSCQDGMCSAIFVPDDKDPYSANPWHLRGKGKFYLQVFENDIHKYPASHPNNIDPLNWEKHGEITTIYPDFTASLNALQELTWLEGDIGIYHAIVERKWNAVQGIIKGVRDGKVHCKAVTSGWGKAKNGTFNKNLFTKVNNEWTGEGKGFLIHSKSILDKEGEWFWDKKSNLLTFCTDKENDKLLIEARSRRLGLWIQNSNFIRLEGIDFKAAAVEINASNHCVIDDSKIEYACPFYDHSDEFNGKAGVSVRGGSHNSIVNSYIAESWGSGLELLNGTNHRLENSIVENVNWMGTYNGCVRISGRSTAVENNILRNSGRFLIYAFEIEEATINANKMYNGMLIGQDGGAFYTHLSDGKGTEIAHNWVYGIQGLSWERSQHNDHRISVGIYLDGGCKNFRVHHNFIWDVKYGVMYNASPNKQNGQSENNQIDHNLIRSSGPSIVSKNLPLYYNNNQVKFNIVNQKIGALASKEGNEMIDDSEFQSIFTKKNYPNGKIGSISSNRSMRIAGPDLDKLSNKILQFVE